MIGRVPIARQSGFTLLEMIIGITLLGFILTLVYGGLRLGTRSWEAGERAIEVSSRQAVVGDFLRRQLSLVYPLRWKNDEGTEVLAFAGEAESLHFAAPVAARSGAGGIHLVSIGKDGEAVRLRWRMPDPELRAFDFPEEKNQARLADGIESFAIAYFGAEAEAEEPAWHDAWQSETRLPSLIRVRMKSADGEAWPDLLVAPMISVEAVCRWDDFYKRCM